MMHSSTIAGSMPARRTASATTSAPSCGGGEALQRAEELAGRRADGADDDGFAHGSRLRIGCATRSTTVRSRCTTSAPSSDCRRAQDDRRRAHRLRAPTAALAASTSSTPPSSLTVRDALERRADGGLPRERRPCRARAARRAAARRARRACAWQRCGLHRRSSRSYHCAMRLILASASPRRAELLRAAGFAFDVVVGRRRRARRGRARRRGRTSRRLAAEKSAAAAQRRYCGYSRTAERPACRPADAVVLGADTAVVVDGEILGKPRDDEDGRGDAAAAVRDGARGADRRQPAAAAPARSARVETTAVVFRDADRRRRSRGTSRAGKGATRPAATRFRGWRRASSRASTGRIRTSSGCRWPCVRRSCCDSLLASRR